MKKLRWPILFWAILIFTYPFLATAQLSLPLSSVKPTSYFGSRIHPITKKLSHHSGIDLRANFEPVFSICDAWVEACGEDHINGKYITINIGKAKCTYGHLSKIIIKKGEKVRAGQLLAISGNSGRSTGPHLHFSLRVNKEYLDPLQLLNTIKKNHMKENTPFENQELPLAVLLLILAEKGRIALSPHQAAQFGLESIDELPQIEEEVDDGK